MDIDRTRFIGGSDAAAILGISPWRTPLDIYNEKTRVSVREQVDPQRAKVFNRGKRMERYIVDLLAEQEGLNIAHRNRRFESTEFPFLACEIDAETVDNCNVEIKTVSPFKAKEWGEHQTDAIPVHYTAQAMHGLMITGRPVCIFGVLIGGDDFRVYRVERDDETIDAMRAREVEFWNEHVLKRVPPDPINLADVLTLFSKDTGRTVEADERLLGLYNELRATTHSIKELETKSETIKKSIQMQMTDASAITLNGAPIVTWKAQTSKRFDQTAFKTANPDLFEQFTTAAETRVFRLK